MKTRSITRRTVIIVLLAQTLLALMLGSLFVWHEWRGRMHALDAQIAGRSDSLLGAIQDAEDPESNIVVDPAELRLPAEDAYAVYSENGRLIGHSGPGAALPPQGNLGIDDVTIDGHWYRMVRRQALRIIDRGEHQGVGLRRPVTIVYAAPTSHVLHETFEAVGISLSAIFVIGAATALVTAWLLQSTLQPIADLAAAAQAVSPASLRFEAPTGANSVEELRPLTATLTALIDEVREAFAKEQRFVGDAAHELKTAVAVERSAIQLMMLRPRSADDYADGLEQLLIDNDRVEALVASMLNLARIDETSAADAPTIDLGEAVRSACDTMEPVALARGVSLSSDVDGDVRVRLHPDRADSLLTNLLSNAIRHSAVGASVGISAERDAARMMLEVVDEGSGIRAEALPHVFERFYRDDPSRSRDSGGTGLGLAICKSIVESAGGEIHISSVVGEGTRVVVFLPAV